MGKGPGIRQVGQGYSRRTAVEAGIFESKDMHCALITGGTQEGGVMAEIDTRKENCGDGLQLWGLRVPAHQASPVLTSRGWQGLCLGAAPPVSPLTECQTGE